MSIFHSAEFVGYHGLTLYELGDAKLLIGPERGTFGGFSGCDDMATMERLLAFAPRAFSGAVDMTGYGRPVVVQAQISSVFGSQGEMRAAAAACNRQGAGG